MNKCGEQRISCTDRIDDLRGLDRLVFYDSVVLLGIKDGALVTDPHDDDLGIILLPAFLDAFIMIVLKVIIADIEDVGRLQKILLVRDLLSPHAAHIDCKEIGRAHV